MTKPASAFTITTGRKVTLFNTVHAWRSGRFQRLIFDLSRYIQNNKARRSQDDPSLQCCKYLKSLYIDALEVERSPNAEGISWTGTNHLHYNSREMTSLQLCLRPERSRM